MHIDISERIEAVRLYQAVALYTATERFLAVQSFNDALEENRRRAEREREAAARTPEVVHDRDVASAVVSPPTPQWNAEVGAWCWRGCILPQTPCVVPQYVCDREARYIDQANNGWATQGHTASGKYQFVNGTWNGFGGYPVAALAPESVQDDKARLTWDSGNGCAAWSAC